MQHPVGTENIRQDIQNLATDLCTSLLSETHNTRGKTTMSFHLIIDMAMKNKMTAVLPVSISIIYLVWKGLINIMNQLIVSKTKSFIPTINFSQS